MLCLRVRSTCDCHGLQSYAHMFCNTLYIRVALAQTLRMTNACACRRITADLQREESPVLVLCPLTRFLSRSNWIVETSIANCFFRFSRTQGLREEIGALQRRIRELEAQNRALSGLLAQAASPGSPTELIQGILEAGPAAVVAALGLDPAWVPLSRPRSLNLQIPVMAATKCRRNRPLGTLVVTKEEYRNLVFKLFESNVVIFPVKIDLSREN